MGAVRQLRPRRVRQHPRVRGRHQRPGKPVFLRTGAVWPSNAVDDLHLLTDPCSGRCAASASRPLTSPTTRRSSTSATRAPTSCSSSTPRRSAPRTTRWTRRSPTCSPPSRPTTATLTTRRTSAAASASSTRWAWTWYAALGLATAFWETQRPLRAHPQVIQSCIFAILDGICSSEDTDDLETFLSSIEWRLPDVRFSYDVGPPPPPPSTGTLYDFLLEQDAEGIEEMREKMETWCARLRLGSPNPDPRSARRRAGTPSSSSSRPRAPAAASVPTARRPR